MRRKEPRVTTWVSGLDVHIAPDVDRSVLVVIDTQVDFVDGGACPIPGTTQILPNIARLLAAYRDAAAPIVHVVRLYDGDDVDLLRSSHRRGRPHRAARIDRLI